MMQSSLVVVPVAYLLPLQAWLWVVYTLRW